MDGNDFDNLARRLAGGVSRRGLAKGVLGGILGGLAGFRVAQTAAARGPLGAACTRARECASQTCVDGVCCNEPCSGQCEACDLAGAIGLCTPLPAGTQQHGNRPACTGTDVCQSSCDGVTRNQCTSYPNLDAVCGDPVCEAGWQTTYGCGGNGTCHPTTIACGLFACNAEGTACLTSCQDNDDCAGEAHCAGGVCQGNKSPGAPCAGPDQCQSGFCVDGVCCGETCTGTCFACNVPGNEGLCAPAPGAACDDGDPCTIDDACDADGTCRGTPVSCTTPDVCQAAPGTCDPQSGECVYPDAPDNTGCGTNQVCCNGVCQAATEPCGGIVPMGESCTETNDCLPGFGLICANGGIKDSKDQEPCGDVCCTATIGASCAPASEDDNCRCCGGATCECPGDRRCTPENRVCGGIFSPCSTDDECATGRCDDVFRSCCNGLGGFCQDGTHSMCCGSIGCGCGPDAFCGAGTNGACGGIGAPCTSGFQCISGSCDAGSGSCA